MEAVLGKGFRYPLSNLKKHFIALGGTGCGKTVLSKALIEEATLNGIPCILVDPQGDLASLAIPLEKEEAKKHDVDQKKLGAYSKNVRVVVFTPTSSKGIPLCVNPLKLPKKDIEEEDLISILSQISESIARLSGYKANTDKEKNAQALLYLIIMDCWKKGINLKTFDDLADLVLNVPQSVQQEGEAFTKDKKELEALAKKLKYLTIGDKGLLFQFGVPLDIDTLLGKKQGKPQISIIYLNTLESFEDKQFFVSILATSLYQWMLENPSKDLQAIFMIDEIAPFIPAGASKPMAKEILRLIFKQARKYGIGCVVCTQNPGDIDYKAFAQFGTWAIGRLTVKQDVKKVEMALKSLAVKNVEKTFSKLPKLQPSNFLFFCPDSFKDVKDLQVRWLLTEHKTLTDDDVKAITPDNLRASYEKLMVAKPKKAEKFIEQEKAAPLKLKKEGAEHFPINISKGEATKTIEWKKKRMFLLFGPESESIESLNLVLRPIIKTKIIKKEKRLFGTKEREYLLYFDGITGNLLKIRLAGDVEVFEGMQKMVNLSEREIAVFKELVNKKKGMTNTEIASRLGLNESLIAQITSSLKEKKVIAHVEKAGRAFLWDAILQVRIPMEASSAESSAPSIGKEMTEGKQLALNIIIEDLSKFVRAWFKGAIAEASVVYYPYYEARLAGKGKNRMLNLSAVNRRTIKW